MFVEIIDGPSFKVVAGNGYQVDLVNGTMWESSDLSDATSDEFIYFEVVDGDRILDAHCMEFAPLESVKFGKRFGSDLLIQGIFKSGYEEPVKAASCGFEV